MSFIFMYFTSLITLVVINAHSSVYKGNQSDYNDTDTFHRLFNSRSREHISKIFYPQGIREHDVDQKLITHLLEKLVKIYKTTIVPLANAYKFSDISNHAVGEGEIFSVPKVLFVGPWSTGKSSLINYILGIENTSFSLASGAQPTTSDFTILSYKEQHKTVEGSVLVMDSSYISLEKFGQSFLDRLESIRIPSNILKWVNFIDTPGIIENRKQQERGYPFANVCKWFIDRSDLVVVVFDPTKLDVGGELEVLFRQLKQQETKVRIVLNKADTLSSQELLRVYGALFWSLAPLINTTEPPRVYVGSFWSKHFQKISEDFQKLFVVEETTLFQDIYSIICNRIQNKIAFFRKYAVLVRNHALIVDQYLNALWQHRSIFRDVNELALNIMYTPDEYMIFQKVLANADVSKLDLFPRETYREFFSVHPMDSFQPLSKHCGFISLCLLDSINNAIHSELPAILKEFELASKRECSRIEMSDYSIFERDPTIKKSKKSQDEL